MICAIAILSGCTSIQANDMSYHPERKHYYKENQYLNYREIGEGDQVIVFLHVRIPRTAYLIPTKKFCGQAADVCFMQR